MYTSPVAVRVRFAPSPTGRLHVGNVRTALYNWLFARQKEGVLLLRIEDTDGSRSEGQFEKQLKDDLEWFGLDWSEGVDVGGPHAPYRQTERLELYQHHARQLLSDGKAYFCFCSSQELEEERRKSAAAELPFQYSGRCRAIPSQAAKRRTRAGEKAVLRLRVREGRITFRDMVFGPLEVACSEIGDFVLLRSDGTAQYNFACALDDYLMQITDVIRGEGHISNTYRQILVYEALGFEMPRFVHLSTILGKDGRKLSKRHGASSLQEFCRAGYLPQAMANYLAMLGWAPTEAAGEILSIDELVGVFDLSRVNRSPATFDVDKLNWVNRSHLKMLDRTGLIEGVLPYLQEQGWILTEPTPVIRDWIGDISQTLLKYLDKFEDVVAHAKLIFDFNPEENLAREEVKQALAEDGAKEVIRELNNRLEQAEILDVEGYRELIAQVKQATGQKGKQLFHPVRVALTARTVGPELDQLVLILERGQGLDLPVKILGVRERVQSVVEFLR